MKALLAKSLEKDFVSKTIINKRKVPFQTITDMVNTRTIRPNTISFGRKKRLACSALDKEYTDTYRAQGILFSTKNKPDYIAPFDLVLLAATKKILVQYYRISNKLHEYYGHDLIPGFEQFLFTDLASLKKKYPTKEIVWEAINAFRKKAHYPELPLQKFRLVKYVELVFHHPVRIEPVGVFGYEKEARKIAKELNLPHFRNAKEAVRKLLRN